MGDQGRDRAKAVGVLIVALLGFLISLVIGFYFFDFYIGVGMGLLILTIAGFIAYELWWKKTDESE